MSSPVACIRLNLPHRVFTVAYRSGSGRMTYWQELNFIVTTKTYPDCYLSAISHVLSSISSKPSLVSVSGCSSMVFRALETSGLFKNEIQYPFRFEVISLPELMHPNVLQTKHVFGRIDMFTQLKYLVVFLRGCQSQPWALQCPELCMVFIYF